MEQFMPKGVSGEQTPQYCIPPDLFSLAMAYVPTQPWEEIYEADIGLERGTIFRQLDFPWLAGEQGGAHR